MFTTLVAVFQNADAAADAAGAIRQRGLAEEVRLLSRRQDGPEQGNPPVITGPGYGLSAPSGNPPGGEDFGAGAAVGATLGGTAGLLASTYFIPPLGTLTGAGPMVSTMVGAGIGSLLGGLVEHGAAERPGGLANNERDALNYAGTVRIGGVLLVAVCREGQAAACRDALRARGPLELRLHPGGPVGPSAGAVPAATNDAGTQPGPVETSPWPGEGLHGGMALTGGAEVRTGRPGPLLGTGETPGPTNES